MQLGVAHMAAGVAPGGFKQGVKLGVNARTLHWGHDACTRMNSGFAGRWDRNRTCTLRFWSLLPFVQQRSGTYTNTLEIGHFDGPKYQDVHQRSPALGSKLGSTPGNRAL
jgi:hypothetical protein